MKNCIDDLPDPLLVEILCRLPCSKVVLQCTSASKRWFHLISDPSFVGHFLCLQPNRHKPIPSTLAVFAFGDREERKTEVFTTSNSPVFQTSNLSLNGEPIVVATYNDLVLCCATGWVQGDYDVCNPYTKQWVALPPTPPLNNGEIEYSSSTSFDIIHLNTAYRWTIVRLIRNWSEGSYHVEMISTETSGEWKELAMSFNPLQIKHICDNDDLDFTPYAAITHHGMFYWVQNLSECTLELNPFLSSSGDNIAKCHFIKEPATFFGGRVKNWYLGVYGGCLRMCTVGLGADYPFSVWELKLQEASEGDQKFEWFFDRISLPFDDIPLFSEQVNRSCMVEILRFHPNNQDIVYFKFNEHIVMSNLRGGRLELGLIDAKTQYDSCSWREAYAFALPWWPTPIPRL
ncbi:unnamed protein product [Malus baccata var. baccata]